MWYVYLLLCGDDTIYTGMTNDLAKRLIAHKQGTGSRYTRSRGAKKILYSEEFKTRSLALKREASIKKLKRSQKDALLTKASKS